MEIIEPIAALWMARLTLLAVALPVALAIGEWMAMLTGIRWLGRRQQRLASWMVRKLDRAQRSATTRIYRGMIATVWMLAPALILAAMLQRSMVWGEALSLVLLIALLGEGWHQITLLRTLRRARHATLALEHPGTDFLFADSHAVIRHLITFHGERWATGVVGVSFWFVLGGWWAVLPYLALRALAAPERHSIFGWAPRGLFAAMDALPRVVSWVLLILAACFVPGAKPFAARHARHFDGLQAALLGVSLGGVMPEGNRPWVGSGTPKPVASHLGRFYLLHLIGTGLLIVCVACVLDIF